MRRSALRSLAALVAVACASLVVACSDDDAGDTAGTPTTTSTTERPAGSSTTSAASATRSVVVAGTGVLGWWDGARWLAASEEGAAPPIEGGEDYLLVGLDHEPTASTGGAPQPKEEFCSSPFVELTPGLPDGPPGEGPSVGVHGVARPQPRPVTRLDRGSAVYRDAARSALAELGIDEAEPELAQVVRADLTGDGTDEVLVTVERIADPSGPYAQPGDYSVVLLRRVVEGRAVTSVALQSRNESTPDTPSPFIEQLRVSAIADLNGDGGMEVVVDRAYYEGGSVAVHEVRPDGSLEEVLTAGCGV